MQSAIAGTLMLSQQRWLLFNLGSSAGGFSIENKNPSSDGDTEAAFSHLDGNNTATNVTIGSTSDGADIDLAGQATSIFLGVLAGIGILCSFVLATYVLNVICDRCLCCCPFWRPLSFNAATDQGPVSRKAGLAGLLQSERLKILHHLFKPVVWKSDLDKTTTPTTATTTRSNSALEEGGANGEGSDSLDKENTKVATESSEDVVKDASEALSNDSTTDLERTCVICLAPYQDGCQVINPTTCSHMFHFHCSMKWLRHHDDCPYCRTEMMTETDMRQAAIHVLGLERVKEMDRLKAEQQQQQASSEDDDSSPAPDNEQQQLPSEDPGRELEGEDDNNVSGNADRGGDNQQASSPTTGIVQEVWSSADDVESGHGGTDADLDDGQEGVILSETAGAAEDYSKE